MGLIQIYIDEDAGRRGLVHALRSGGVTVITALEAGLGGSPDEQQLAYAMERGYVLYSHNVSDFYRLHTDWSAPGVSTPEQSWLPNSVSPWVSGYGGSCASVPLRALRV